MALSAAEEAQARELIAQQAALLSLAGNEATITSKLGATKVNVGQLPVASALADADLLLVRQGTTDKSVASSVAKTYIGTGKANSGANADITSMTALTAPTVAANPVRATDLQVQLATAFTTGGTSTAFTLTPTPAITANAANQRFRVKFNAAAGATPTLAVSGLTALNLKYKDSAGAKQAITSVQVPINWVSDVENDGTDWVVLDVPPSAAASETVAGLLEIATAAEAQAFTANKAIDGAKLAAAMQGANQSLASNGYQKLPGGLIIQWGSGTAAIGGTAITFPIAFPNACRNVISSGGNNNDITVNAYSQTTTQFTADANTGGGGPYSFQWQAIGN